MCSELFRIPLQVGGIPLFSGLLMVAWIIVTGYGMLGAARLHGWKSAAAGHLPTLVIGVALLLFLPRFFTDGVPVRGYGVMLVIGSTCGVVMATHRARQVGLNPEEIVSLAIGMFIGGIAGGRIFYVVEYWGERFKRIDLATGQIDWAATLRESMNFTEGGLVVYGAFLGAMAAFFAFTLRRRLPALAMADLIAPSLAIGLAFGRIGCLMNGCCYGGESSAPWALTFPSKDASQRFSPPYADQARNGRFYGFRIAGAEQSGATVVQQVDADSPADAAGLRVGDRVASIDGDSVESLQIARQLLFESVARAIDTGDAAPLRIGLDTGDVKEIAATPPPARSWPVHPTQIYSAVNAGLLAWLLWAYYPWRRRDGEVLALLLTVYPIARFLLEKIRIDENAMFAGLSISQNISIVLFLASLLFWRRLRTQPPLLAAFPRAATATATTAA